MSRRVRYLGGIESLHGKTGLVEGESERALFVRFDDPALGTFALQASALAKDDFEEIAGEQSI